MQLLRRNARKEFSSLTLKCTLEALLRPAFIKSVRRYKAHAVAPPQPRALSGKSGHQVPKQDVRMNSLPSTSSIQSNVSAESTSMSIPPVIDIAPLICPDQHTQEHRDQVISQICQACETWGFFHVTSHGIPQQLQLDLQTQMRAFFLAADPEIRESVRRTASNSRGYADDELTKQLKDSKQIFDVGEAPRFQNLPEDHPKNHVQDGYNQWPNREHLPEFKSTVSSYFEACTHLCDILLGAVVESLGPGAREVMTNAFEEHTSFLRLNYYPVVQKSAEGTTDKLGISRHTDSGAITVIMQDGTAALEVYSGSKQDACDGTWVPVDPVSGALTINTGDMLMVWSNGRFKAPEHRVRAMTKVQRYSAPYFYNPSYDAIVAPLTSWDQHQSPRYRPIVWGDFRRQRFAGDYSNLGKEIQIEDFLI